MKDSTYKDKDHADEENEKEDNNSPRMARSDSTLPVPQCLRHSYLCSRHQYSCSCRNPEHSNHSTPLTFITKCEDVRKAHIKVLSKFKSCQHCLKLCESLLLSLSYFMQLETGPRLVYGN